jgi:chaperonin GroEL
MSKELLFGREAKEKMLNGVRIVSKAVGSTLGPKASNVAIDREYGTPQVIHDGVSVAREIDLKDKFENIGASLVKEAAQKTNDQAGDGTTTSTILTESIAEQAFKNITAGSNSRMIRKGINEAVAQVVERLKSMSKKVTTPEEVRQVAVISAQDEEIGSLISGCMKKLGNDCVIAVEESASTEMGVEYKEGMEFSKGYTSPYFITNHETNEAIVENPYIITSNLKINSMTDFIPFVKKFEETVKEDQSQPTEGFTPGNNLVIIADEVSGAPLATLIANKIKSLLNIIVIQAPEYGDNRKEILSDISILTGGLPIMQETGGRIDNISSGFWGRARRVISTKDSTIIIDGFGKKEEIKSRINQIKNRIEKSDSEFETEKLKERLAKLTSGIAVITVGANSEMEMREKKECCIDAISATKSAIEEGLVPGGETALLIASYLISTNEKEKDIVTGFEIIREACKKPFEVLMTNSGYNAGQMLERLMNSAVDNAGIDVMDGEIKDMIKAGIVDPVKVSRCALQNASSCATMLSTTDTLIVTEKENDTRS